MEMTEQYTDGDSEKRFGYFSGIEDYGAKIDFDYLPNPNHYIRFGANYTYHTFSPGAMELDERENTDIFIDTSFNFSETLYANESFLYVEDDIKVNDQH